MGVGRVYKLIYQGVKWIINQPSKGPLFQASTRDPGSDVSDEYNPSDHTSLFLKAYPMHLKKRL